MYPAPPRPPPRLASSAGLAVVHASRPASDADPEEFHRDLGDGEHADIVIAYRAYRVRIGDLA